MTAEQYCSSILDQFGRTDKYTILDLMEGYANFKYGVAVETTKKVIMDIVENESFHLDNEKVVSVADLLKRIDNINSQNLSNV